MAKTSDRTRVFLGILAIIGIMVVSYIVAPGNYRRSPASQLSNNQQGVSPTPSPNQELTNNLTTNTETIKEEGSDLSYTVDAQYPKISNMKDQEAQNKLNNEIKNFVSEKINLFKKDLAELKTTGDENLMKSELSINSQTTFLDDSLASIKFSMYEYYSGAAHPDAYVETLNYDAKNSQIIELKDIFKTDSKYLEILSETSKTKLLNDLPATDRATFEPWVSDGTSAKSDNFKNFGFSGKNLIIYFNPYQVGSYALGIQEVSVPLEDIKNELEPKSAAGEIISF